MYVTNPKLGGNDKNKSAKKFTILDSVCWYGISTTFCVYFTFCYYYKIKKWVGLDPESKATAARVS